MPAEASRFTPELYTDLQPYFKSEELRALKELFDEVPEAGEALWQKILQTKLLSPTRDFKAHKKIYSAVYGARSPTYLGPLCFPSSADVLNSRLYSLAKALDAPSNFFEPLGVSEFQLWTAQNRELFWSTAIEQLEPQFEQAPSQYLTWNQEQADTQCLEGAKYNMATQCFLAEADSPAIISQCESAEPRSYSYAELESLSCAVAVSLRRRLGLQAADAVAIDMPMHLEAVAIYLGCLIAGCRVVSIADSFAPAEIATRLRLGQAKVIFTQDSISRGGKEIPLYTKVIEAANTPAVVLGLNRNRADELRLGDQSWTQFLGSTKGSTHEVSYEFAQAKLKIADIEPHLGSASDIANILFSSGTTGDPKVIPWTQATPFKCGVDAALHHDIQKGDILCWPTNLGWMMGPWLIFAGLLNRACVALYDGAPHGVDFARFLERHRVSMLGVVPSLVKTWRQSEVFNGIDLSSIRSFSSTGECSSPEDMHWLSSRAHYKPIIEYCGGTEIGGAYLSSTRLQPNLASSFSCKSFGGDFIILDEHHQESQYGEVYLIPPSIGLSNTLLNRDHFETYFKDTPAGPKGSLLRRHGDEVEELEGGYFRAHGRSDDTMNLGGIKVSSAEIERCVNTVAGVKDSAAIAVAPQGGGPSELVLAVVLSEDAPDFATLQKQLQSEIRSKLNPLYKIAHLWRVDLLPRTASNKVMRRVLRKNFLELHKP